MDNLKNNYLWVVVVLIAIGAWFAYLSSQTGFISVQTSILNSSGEISKVTQIQQSAKGAIYSISSLFLFSLGASIFISLFVSNKIEAQLAEEKENELRKIQEAINVDVFDSLFKKLVPEEIFRVIKSDVINNKIVRKDANWIYDFRELEHDKTKIELTQTIKYELHNVSHEPINDAINAVFDAHGIAGLRRAVCMLEGKVSSSYETPSDTFEIPDKEVIEYSDDKTVTITRTPDGYTKVSIDVNIPPSKKIDVTLVYITIYENNYVNDGYFTKYPMINATLTATYPEDYEFDIFQSLSSTMQKTLSEKNRSIYEVKGGILPRQGIVFTLKKANK